MLTNDILEQVKGVFAGLQANYTLLATIDKMPERGEAMKAFLDDFVSTSDKLTATYTEGTEKDLGFDILKEGQQTGIRFRGIPNGHEFTSLLLAILNADGKGKNLPDEALVARIKALKGDIKLQTYVSLTCTNCPDVVQALNVMVLLNSRISHEMIDGALFQNEVDEKRIQAVPTVFANGEVLHIGRGDLGELLQKLEDKFGTEEDAETTLVERSYDVVVVGGGPAGAASAIYSARKGLKVALVAGRIGGQVKDTVGIENLISVPKTTGNQLAADLRSHLEDYDIEIFENRKIETVEDAEAALKRVKAKGGEVFVAPALVIATGAGWRKLNVEGENQYLGHGVHFCPHCDGPFYKGKNVAVVGGGNSGIEAAIDLAGICEKVTVLEFSDVLRADNVLVDKAKSLSNVEILMSSQTMEVKGDGNKVTAIAVKDRTNEEIRDIALDGIFVQIGLAPNSDVFKDVVPMSPRNEIIVDEHCRTAIKGIYAAGDVTTVPFKQIIVAMGEGAKAALAAHEDRIRGVIG